MVEIFISFGVFFGLFLLVLAAIFLIPRWVILSTEAEKDPNHIYSIFMKESGYRGHKILSAVGCLLPLVALSKPSYDFMGLVLIFIISIVCIIYHSSVYKGYPVLSRKVRFYFAAMFISLTVASILTNLNILSENIFLFLFILSGLFWGGYSVYRRSLIIRTIKHSSKDAS